ncbi:MAG: AAA family ATPase [Lachnospiraceae bacterium]|nr:AAA family ATPase [Lachnospiraceae bacterium]MBP5701003.1 AAA family ATPase [Lachnospiraceae bacterium]
MNIASAKQVIKDTVRIYLKKDEYGEYCIPTVRQRPIFMLGAPGIGKTAIMEQIASEMGIAFVSYSMTHHTRQSALGLPYITTKKFGDTEYSITEYTMSEIIASVYEAIDKRGVKEGILFLDEINCVSETLGPSMLQFLQYKTFGRHSLPEGWVIVTAGNPPEYNRSVREFDVATLDRMKVITVEPELKAWMEYARERSIHGAILAYLDVKKEDFYVMDMSPEGRAYVTARGWEDLSEMMKLSEEEKITIDETLISQYLRSERVAKDFAAYYDLYIKYKTDYHIAEILEGRAPESIYEKMNGASFDERLSVLSMLTESVSGDMKETLVEADAVRTLTPVMKSIKDMSEKGADDSEVQGIIRKALGAQENNLKLLQERGNLSRHRRRSIALTIDFYNDCLKPGDTAKTEDGRPRCLDGYNSEVVKLKEKAMTSSSRLSNLISFVRKACEGGNEPMILATRLTSDTWSSRFISTFGNEDYEKLAGDMEISERGLELKEQIAKFDI